MAPFYMLIAIMLPMVAGILIPVLPVKRTVLKVYMELAALLTSALVFGLICNRPLEDVTLFQFTRALSISFRLDGVGSVFAAIVAFLWPLALLYAMEYMKHETHQRVFYTFYLVTYGVTLGICMAQNLVTLYFFYEMLTLVTVPLVIHSLTREAVHAARTYLYYSLGGAAFAFIGMIFVLSYGTTADFVAGGVFDLEALGEKKVLLQTIYVLCFCGFSVKAAMFPFSGWLPKAGVAPTPVTALLHAVAVVKAGAFATIRITYFCFGPKLLKGSFAQTIVCTLTIITIVYGCSRALKETHFKRRLAWSTVSNLSYILFGVTLMSYGGLLGALLHMVCHACMKICSFFCAGAVMHQTEKNYIYELDGLGKDMPLTFGIFTIAGMALMGVPGLAGFVSKWYLARAAVQDGYVLAMLGLGAILISALLTALYMMSISVRAFFAKKQEEGTKRLDPNWMMLLPLVVFVGVMLVIGLRPQLLISLIEMALTEFGINAFS